ncbi:hypothetical protein FLONG3_5839 [Fusarium longipes]|uniref:Uncharacterized protein n=1 Tax=Fusarium longipes TaxID=694270 RepID=A0A395STA4_9HYPO|nr:hypothetical protein FLONG3_5839 [Fusarium longipes]
MRSTQPKGQQPDKDEARLDPDPAQSVTRCAVSNSLHAFFVSFPPAHPFMEAISPPPLARTLSRTEGFLSCIFYIASIHTILGQDFNAESAFFHRTEQWAILRYVYSQLEDIRQRLCVNETESNCTPNMSWNFDSIALDSVVINQDEQFNYTISASTQITSTQTPDLQRLQRSPIVTNLTHFLEKCGELPLILSSHGETANWRPISTSRPAEFESEYRRKRLYLQALQDDGSHQDPATRAILCIVDRFIELNFLQNAAQMTHYLHLLGKEIFPSYQVQFDFCHYVKASAVKAEERISSL